MTTRALADHLSPCRIDKRKGARRHRCSAHHADLVEGYRLAVEAQNARAEAATAGYETELAQYFHPHDGTERRLTLRDWLMGYR
jgi:hypothetical protein